MKIVILSELTPRDWIVVQEILRSFSHVTLIHLTRIPERRRKYTGNWFSAIGKKILKKIYKIRLNKVARPNLEQELNYQMMEFPSRDINSKKGISLIQELNPDILFTCWAPILKEPLLKLPNIAAINAHFGISPDYRGNDTVFWALYNQDFEKVGGCLHYISQEVDAGNILAQVHPALVKGDGELSLELKIAHLLSQAAVKVLQTIQNNETLPHGKVQVEKGRNYKAAERTFTVELKYMLLQAAGYREVKTLQERVELFI